MIGVLIVAHGSRARDTEQTMQNICEMVRQELKDTLIIECYMEFRKPSIEMGLSDLVAQGVHDIKIIPYFLFEGIHIKEDIPQEIQVFCKNNPLIQVTMGHTLGADPRLAAVVADRIREML